MPEFIRSFSDKMIEKIKKEELFNKLLMDIKKTKGSVFPAIRNESISFYYKGGGIFSYGAEGFKSNKKYCFVPKDSTNNYLTESQLVMTTAKQNFCDAYEDIKERCEMYGGIEAETISALYGYSGVSQSDIILLDIEVCFVKELESVLEEKKYNYERIDLLLYDKTSRKLCFCEAKHFTNKEIWAQKGSKPAVCCQIARYNDEIRLNYGDIIEQYKNYINTFNKLFETNIPEPVCISPQTGLIVFGYDSYQQEKLKKLLVNDGSLDEIPYYFCQYPDNIEYFYKDINKIKY